MRPDGAVELAGDVIRALRSVVGDSHVLCDRPARQRYETATFLTTQQVLAIVLPASTAEVQQVVRLANRFGLSLYPISRGRNWGLGSKVPVRGRSVVVDLQRMNRILDFDAQLSYVTVEPGVTFRQLADFLKARRVGLYLSVIGGPPDASVLGNTVERGDGLGPLGDRSAHCCALQAVVGTGELIETGMAMFGNEAISRLAGAGVGPELSGLFFQSNLAIVTRLTVWLARAPEAFQGVTFAISDPSRLAPVVRAMRTLQQRGVLKASSFALWNMHKFLASTSEYPFTAQGRPLRSPDELLSHVPPALRGVRWIGMAALYSASQLHAYADRREARAALGEHVSQLAFVGHCTSLLTRLAGRLAPKILGMDAARMVPLLYDASPFLGNPTEFSIQSVYWRKRGPKPAQLDPDRDRCGLHWVCTGVPFDDVHIARHAALVEQVAREHALEPNLSYLNVSERYLRAFAVIAYDRDADDEEARAQACHDRMLAQLVAAGFPPVRLGVQSMRSVRPCDPQYSEWLRRLKQVFDPNDVLAAGRYDFRHDWTRPLAVEPFASSSSLGAGVAARSCISEEH